MRDKGIKDAVRRLRGPSPRGIGTAPESTFDALLEQRLGQVERLVDELKTRINGLVFLIAGAVLVQITLGFLGWR